MPFAVKRRHEIEKKIKEDASKCRKMSEFFIHKAKKDGKKDELTSPETDNSGSSEEHDLHTTNMMDMVRMTAMGLGLPLLLPIALLKLRLNHFQAILNVKI